MIRSPPPSAPSTRVRTLTRDRPTRRPASRSGGTSHSETNSGRPGGELGHEFADLGLAGEVNLELRGVGALDQQRVEVGEVLSHQNGRDEGTGDRRVGRPVEELDQALGELAREADRFAAGCDEVGVLEQHGDLERVGAAGPVLSRRHALQARAQEAVDQLERTAWLAREQVAEVERRHAVRTGVGQGRPRGALEAVEGLEEAVESVAALGHPDAMAAVEPDHHVEGREHHLGEEVRQRDEVHTVFRRRRDQVVNVAGEHELARGAGSEQAPHLLGPGRQRRSRHLPTPPPRPWAARGGPRQPRRPPANPGTRRALPSTGWSRSWSR